MIEEVLVELIVFHDRDELGEFDRFGPRFGGLTG